MAKKSEPTWGMPAWMEPYREHFTNTGGNSVENLMNDHESTMFNNSVRVLLIHGVAAQVALLLILRDAGMLIEPKKAK